MQDSEPRPPSCDLAVTPLCPSALLGWDDSHGHRFTHDLFKFPGKFHPPIVENILKRLCPRTVIDPMAGVGTVSVEAKAAGIASLSIDVDPVSVFIARAKTTPISRAALEDAWSDFQPVLRRIRRSAREIERLRFEDIALATMRRRLATNGHRGLASLQYWFRRYVLADFALLDHSIWNGGLERRGAVVRRFFKACLLSAVRRISNADPYPVSGLEITKHMRERLTHGYVIDVASEFERRVLLNIERMAAFYQYLEERRQLGTPVQIIQADCIRLVQIKERWAPEVDLILFSPPYCNAIEYWRRHRLEYFLGGFLTPDAIPEIQRRFIGRRTIGRRSAERPPSLNQKQIDLQIKSLHEEGRREKAWQLWNYFHDMGLRLEVFCETLRAGGVAVLVVGDSHTGGHRIPTAAILQDLAEKKGFAVETTACYSIMNRSMQYPLKEGSAKIADETIVVLRKP